MAKMVALELGLIDEGKLLKDVNEDLHETVQQLIKYRHKHKDKAIGSKAELNLKIKIVIDESEDGYSIKGEITRKVPARPARVTMAVEDKEQTGEATLFVRKAGSSHDNPRQGHIDDLQDHEEVDPATGEIRKKPKAS